MFVTDDQFECQHSHRTTRKLLHHCGHARDLCSHGNKRNEFEILRGMYGAGRQFHKLAKRCYCTSGHRQRGDVGAALGADGFDVGFNGLRIQFVGNWRKLVSGTQFIIACGQLLYSPIPALRALRTLVANVPVRRKLAI